jgi:DNA-directed RNA polymerase delta subunit
MIKNIDDIEIHYIKSLIPKRPYKRLIEYNIKTVGDLKTINLTAFQTKYNVSNPPITIIKKLIHTINVNPNEIFDVYDKNRPVMIPIISRPIPQNVIQIFKEIISFYFQHKKVETEKNIIDKRYGISEPKKLTFEEIRLFFDKTRERIRQIHKYSLTKIKEFLLKGYELETNIIINPDYHHILLDYINQMSQYKVIRQNTALSLATQNDRSTLSNECLPFFDLLMESLNGKPFIFRKEYYYTFDSRYTTDILIILFPKIISTIRKPVLPISESKLVVNVKKRNELKNVRNDIIIQSAKLLPGVNVIAKGKDTYYALEFQRFNSGCDQAFLILHQYNKPTHFRELAEAINRRLSQSKRLRRVRATSLAGMLVNDSRFVPVGKSGKWALSHWRGNTSTILDATIDALKSLNRPANETELFTFVQTMRPDISKNSIYSVLNKYGKNFIKTTDNNFILKDWEATYKDKIDKNPVKPKQFQIKDFDKKLCSCFNSDPSIKLKLRDVMNCFKKKGEVLPESTIYVRLNQASYLNKVIESEKEVYYSLKNDYKTILDKKKSNPKIFKFDLVNKELESRFEEKQTIYLRDFIKLVSHKFNIHRTITYNTISRREDILKSKDDSGKMLMTLKSERMIRPEKNNQ